MAVRSQQFTIDNKEDTIRASKRLIHENKNEIM
jgi:hypothetical protein